MGSPVAVSIEFSAQKISILKNSTWKEHRKPAKNSFRTISEFLCPFNSLTVHWKMSK